MPSILKIKRSTGNSAPVQLASGELAYAWDAANGFAGGKLYLGTGSETAGAAANIDVIGGKYFADMMDHTRGTLVANSALLTDGDSKLDQLKVDNLDLNGNSITSTNTNGDISITPNGTGKSIISNLYTDANTSLQSYINNISTGSYSFTEGEGIDISSSTVNGVTTVTISGESASTTNLGIASFNDSNFTVSNGAVSSKSITLGSSTLTLGSTTTVVSGLTQLTTDNIRLDDNTISITNTNGSLTLAPNGTGTINASSSRITNLADPVNSGDAATKAYVDAARSGLDVKQSVRVATTANINLNSLQTIDNITLVENDRVLVKNQTVASENGIYTASSGNWSRSADADNSPAGGEVTSGLYTFVEEGTINQSTGYVLTTTGSITLDTTALTFTVFTTSGTVVAGSGLIKSGDTLAVQAGGGLTIASDTVQIASSAAGAGLAFASGVLSVNAAGGLEVASDTVQIASSAAGAGLTFAAGVLSVNVTGGLEVVSDNVQLADTVAGEGLAITGKVLSVNASGGLEVATDTVRIANSAAGAGLTLTSGVLSVNASGGLEVVSDNVRLASSAAGNGLTLTSGVLAVGAGTGLTANADDIALTGQALSLHNLATNGFFVRTGTTTVDARSITSSGTGISVTNGDGVSGNPTITLAAALASIGALTPTADSLAYYTGAATAALATFTSFARTLLDDADAATARTTLGLGSMATQAATSVAITGGSITNLTTLDGVTLDGGTY